MRSFGSASKASSKAVASSALPSIVETHTSTTSAAAAAAAIEEAGLDNALEQSRKLATPLAGRSTQSASRPTSRQTPANGAGRPRTNNGRANAPDTPSSSTSSAPAVPNQTLTEEQLQELREIFSLVDVDRGGTISSEELGKLMATLGLKTTKSELQAMVTEIDKDGNGEIDFEEFVAVMSRKVSTSFTAEKLRWAFKQFEDDPIREPGLVSREMLIFALCHYGSDRLTQDDADDLVAQIIPSDSRNKFDYEDYLNVMFSN